MNGELPHTLHVVAIQQLIRTQHWYPQILSLGHEQAVEWIPMMQRQETGPSGVPNGDCQFSESFFLKPLRESGQ